MDMRQTSIPAVISRLLRLQGPTLRDLAANMEGWMVGMKLTPTRRMTHPQLHGWHTGTRVPISRNEALLRAFYTYALKRHKKEVTPYEQCD